MLGRVSLVKTRARDGLYILCPRLRRGLDMVRPIVKEIMRLTLFPPIFAPCLAAPVHLRALPEDGKRVADFLGLSVGTGTCS